MLKPKLGVKERRLSERLKFEPAFGVKRRVKRVGSYDLRFRKTEFEFIRKRSPSPARFIEEEEGLSKTRFFEIANFIL